LFSYLLVAVMVASLVYVIYLLGEYRPFVEESALKIDRLTDAIERVEKEMVQDEKQLAEAQDRVGVALDRHDKLQDSTAGTSKQLSDMKLMEAQLEAEKNKADYRRSR